MKNTEVSITSLIKETLRNGTRDNINKSADILSFILGAIDCGFSVKLNGYMPYAKYGKIEVYLKWKRDIDELVIVIFKGKEKQCEFDYGFNQFMWVNSEVNNGRFNTETNGRLQFICSTS